MKRTLHRLLMAGVGLLLLWLLTVQVAQRMVGGASHEPTELEAVGGEAPLDELLDAALADAELLHSWQEPRQDSQGEWSVHLRRYRLTTGQDAQRLSARLEGLLTDSTPADHPAPLRAYLTQDDALDHTLRVYQGKRLTHQLQLLAELKPLPAPSSQALVALVVTGLGDDGPAGERVLNVDFPLTVAIRPFTPFALLHSKQAVRSHKEVLLQLDDSELAHSAGAAASMEALMYPSGVFFSTGDPTLLAPELLAKRAMYALLPPSGLTEVRRALRQAHAGTLGIDQQLDGSGLAGLELRLLHLADRQGTLVITVPVEDPSLNELLRWIPQQRSRLRPAFASEVLDHREHSAP